MIFTIAETSFIGCCVCISRIGVYHSAIWLILSIQVGSVGLLLLHEVLKHLLLCFLALAGCWGCERSIGGD